MSGVEATPPARRYRLRGEIGGAERRYPLAIQGVVCLGSVRGNDVVLPVRGVSRRHARLLVDNAGVTVEDLDSKNGVLLNGARVRRAAVGPGDELGLGPVTLRLEEVASDDAELALALDPQPRGAADEPVSEQTTAVVPLPGDRADWLALVEGFVTRLCVVPEGDLPSAMALIAVSLPVRGACAAEWSQEGEPVLLAAAGNVPTEALEGLGRELLREVRGARRAEPCWATLLESDPPCSCAVLVSREGSLLALSLWGDFPGRAESPPLLRALARLVDRLRPKPLHALQGSPALEGRRLAFPAGYVAGSSAAMAALYSQMAPLVQGDIPVLILGETGVGKEFVARTLHASSPRSGGPFVAVNCAAIPPDLLEAEMFGIARGVATGVTERQGKFQLAQGGTLFLDEIGDMSQDLQAKLLRALQEKEVQPVGGAPVPVDIRVVTATNSDLLKGIEAGRFRRDLYYRVAGFALSVPPLRERREDVPALVEAFVRRFSRDTGRRVRGITVKALRRLVEHGWPGNVRELEHEVRRLVYLCPDGEAIDSAMLSEQLLAPPTAAESDAGAGEASLDTHLQRVELRLIRDALARCGGNRSQAARLLGISRNGLALKMERLGIR